MEVAMGIILILLKTIGILLLILLAVIVTALLLLLFVPVRYKVEGSYREIFCANAKVSWLFGVFGFHIGWKDGLLYKATFFGFCLWPRPKKISKRDRKDSAPSESEQIPRTDKIPQADKNPKVRENSQADITAQADTNAEEMLTKPALAPGKKNVGIFQKFISFLEKCKSRILEICDTIKNIKDNFAYYRAVLVRDETKSLFSNTMSAVGKICAHIKPRKLRIYGVVGTGDPASTGQLLAIEGMLYPWLANRIRIVPDFEKKRLEGEFFIAGHILFCVLVWKSLQILFQKELWQFIKLIQKKEEA